MKNVVREVLCFALTIVLSNGESPPQILKDPSFLQLLNKHYTSVQPPKINLVYGGDQGYRPRDDYPFSGTGYESSPGYDPHQGKLKSSNDFDSMGPQSQTYGQRTQTEKPSAGDKQLPISSQEYWNPTNALTTPWNATHGTSGYNEGFYGKPQPFSDSVRSNSPQTADPMQGSYSFHRYQQIRNNFVTAKKPPAYYGNGKIVKVGDAATKPTNIKYKKVSAPLTYYTSPNHNPNPYKKMVYPKVHVPYAVHKHPTKKIAAPMVLHPYYKKYYPYYNPQYLIPSKAKKPYGYPEGYIHYRNPETSTVTPDTKISSTTEKYPTTERMDGIYSGKPLNYDDYTNYNDTYNKSNNVNNFYETYEEQEEPPAENSGYELEATTRGYYGDRIYMSTQGPEKNKNSGNRLYFVRSEARDDDEDSETIFD